MDCPRGFKNLCEITNHVGDETRECDKCDNMTYSAGLLTCSHVLNAMKNHAEKEYKSQKRGL